jgi:hypothetical protein
VPPRSLLPVMPEQVGRVSAHLILWVPNISPGFVSWAFPTWLHCYLRLGHY